MLTKVTNLDLRILKKRVNVNHGLQLTLGKVGQGHQGVRPPRIRVTNRGQTKALTKVIDFVSQLSVIHQCWRIDVGSVLVSVGAKQHRISSIAHIEFMLQILFLWVKPEPFRFDGVNLPPSRTGVHTYFQLFYLMIGLAL